MKKEELAKLGLTDEQITAVLNAHKEAVKDFVPKTRLDEVIEERNGLRNQVEERDNQIAELGKSAGDNEALKNQIAELQTANTKAAEEYQKNLQQARMDNAINLALAGAKAKNGKAVRALLDLEKIKVGEDGTAEGLEDQLKALQKSDAYLFEDAAPKQPQMKGVVPKDGDGNPAPKAVKDMTYAEMCEHLAAGGTLE